MQGSHSFVKYSIETSYTKSLPLLPQVSCLLLCQCTIKLTQLCLWLVAITVDIQWNVSLDAKCSLIGMQKLLGHFYTCH